MSEVDNTSRILYHYLRALHVKVSKMTVRRLLDNPLGNSMRGISDALDALHINNGVYQLPKDYLDKLENPCIATTTENDSPFCLVERIEEEYIIITTSHAQQMRVTKQQFLQKWTGGILISEVSEQTIQEKNCRLKDIAEWIRQYQLLLAGIVTAILILYSTGSSVSKGISLYLLTLCTGMFVSSAILYKEMVNSRFLHSFCHIGKVVDCNEVLHSKGSRIVGMGLGELSLFYFCTLLLFALIRPHDFYFISVLCNIGALGFTIYSVIYQAFVVRKGCMLCMIINIIVWSSSIILYLTKSYFYNGFSIDAAFTIIAISCIYLAIWMHIKKLLKYNEERKHLKNLYTDLLSPEVFQSLLALNPQIGEMPKNDIALHNNVIGENQLLFVTNPNCISCAKMHSQIQKIDGEQPISIILLTFPGDTEGKQVAQAVIARYLKEGWEKAMELLSDWYKKHQIEDTSNCITDEVQEIWEQQQLYCFKQNIKRTPSTVINKHYLPYCYNYQIENLKYVLT